ncbi:MAG: hypothetical protein H6865_03215 [Rhodospirillales bacterium]|nr:hypothetical protein [Alphaproteobacteria bacterium]MCB9986628.1 hypothetical protein [Rhodospirillales bacterium]USO06843.1 MAG: hypothetical protein H6866_05170 [Rhodospirillales bacterium]
MLQKKCGLAETFDHASLIEDTLKRFFPRTWDVVYYYDPKRGRTPSAEARFLSETLGNTHKLQSRRALQAYENDLALTIRRNTGRFLPFAPENKALAGYIMVEILDGPNDPRLRDFFGNAVLDKTPSRTLLVRLYEEFVVRHEITHGVELFENPRHTLPPIRLRERLADANAVLSLLRDHGEAALFFIPALIAARDEQAKNGTGAHHQTQDALHRVFSYVKERGIAEFRDMDDQIVFQTAARLANTLTPC